MTIDCCCTIGGPRDAEPGAEALSERMDEAGVDRAVVHPPERCFAWDNDEGNGLVLDAVNVRPGRFIAAVTANPWRGDAWGVIAPRLVAGWTVVAFHPGVQGFPLSGHLLDPILERLAQAAPAVPVYAHTGHHAYGAPTQLGLVARRFPALRFIMGHCGATDYADDVVSVCAANPNIYPESSFARPFSFVPKVIELGAQCGIMGSGFPYNDLSFEWQAMREALPPEHHEGVLGGNLCRVLGGDA